MLDLFNPFKTAAGIISTTLTLTLLIWTHSQAFRLGVGVNRNPIIRSAAEMAGIASPQESCLPSEEANKTWWEKIPGLER